jgi:16S rRNA (adenine1518-N6/adenine1519-N6)-dimethyltransferase
MNVPDLLRKYGLRPDKSLGQNFLIDESALQKVTEAAELQPGDQVLEIGPGLGSLTRLLAQRARRVVAVELDADLLPPLRETLAPFDNVSIVHGDIMEQDIAALMRDPLQDAPIPYRVAANIPYYITSALIRRLLETPAPPEVLVLTVQREVAQRICAAPGDLSLLALGVQVYGAPRIVGRIPAGAFYPPPQIDSAILRIDLFPQPVMDASEIDAFFRLAKAGFSQKRKTLRNALSAGLHLAPAQAAERLTAAGIDPMRRAETLSIDEWRALLHALA